MNEYILVIVGYINEESLVLGMNTEFGKKIQNPLVRFNAKELRRNI